MNEAEYVLRQDIREKKSAGRGAYHKRSGSKTSYVSLPSDHLSKAEWKRRNGPLETYNISTVIRDWGTFCRLPSDLAETYLRNIISTYNLSQSQVAGSFAITPGRLTNTLKAKGIEIAWSKGRRRTDYRWPDFLQGGFTTTGAPVKTSASLPDPEPTDEEPDEDDPFAKFVKSVAAPVQPAIVHSIQLMGTGKPTEVVALIRRLLSQMARDDKDYTFTLDLKEAVSSDVS